MVAQASHPAVPRPKVAKRPVSRHWHRRRRPGEVGERRGQKWFSAGARYWLDVYRERSLEGQIYRARLGRSIGWVDVMANLSGVAVLDAGCGAGDVALELARRGADVVAADLSAEMVEMTNDRVRAEQLNVQVLRADVDRLPYPDGHFDLVVALGLLPWVDSPRLTMDELARVTRPGGQVIVSFDNSLRLFRLIDPRLSPLTEPARRVIRQFRGRVVRGNLCCRPRRAREVVTGANLHVSKTSGVGFGPPTLLGHPVLPESWAMALDTILQRHADGGSFWLSRLGVHYLVLATRASSG